MARDYGGVDLPRWRRGQRGLFLRHWISQILLVGGFLVFAALPTAFAISGGFHSDKPNFETQAPGPPCREIGEAEFDRGWNDPPHRFSFGAATFARRRGDADCTARAPGGVGPAFATCNFDAPWAIAATFDGKTRWWSVAGGYSATVDARRSGLTCRVTGKFHYYPGT
ncbi:hypothetical protein [Phenylobacterium sp.]|uniref:hypothetical protein n=1 Tax=Phenylobacterium sp. TaxID=1871053 RepID=UPI002DE39B78|nr:hypothetical protein [Phenylobacterium sp.]